jgi:integrase
MGKLTANEAKAALASPGSYQDGDGLFLKVSKGKGASWVVRVQHEGKRRDYYLGSARLVTLAEARAKAAEHRKAVRIEGRDLTAEKRREKAAAVTFREAAKALHEAHKAKWHQPKHAAQWLATLETYAFPSLGERPVGEIEARHIIAAIAKVWSDKPETGRRVRQRICAVLDYAHAHGWRASEAPARSLQAGKGLPRQPARDTHRLAMSYADIPAFLQSMRARFSFGRLALQFTILTAARSGEVRGAVWDEIDMDSRLWTIPGRRMKARREHVVPLSAPALAVLEKAKAMQLAGTELVFPGMQSGKQMSDMTLLKVLRDAGEPHHVHGFRSSFRDWVSEETNFPGDVAEAALAHLVANKVEAAYRRGNLLEKRRKMMDAWGAYCDGAAKGAKVVPLRKRAGQ